MTLHKAIEAARSALEDCIEAAKYFRRKEGQEVESYGEVVAHQALSALPAKPLSEDAMYKAIAKEITKLQGHERIYPEAQAIIDATIKALRNAGVLYVEEK